MKPRYRALNFQLSTLTLTCSALLVTPLLAADYSWTGATSNVYNLSGNWNPNTGTPGTGDNVLIDTNTPNPTAIPSGNWDRRGAGTTTINGSGSVTLNTGSARFLNSGAFNMLGGQLVTSGEYFIVGTGGGGGTATQSGGSIDATLKRGFFLSDAAGDLGSTYNLSAGTLSVKSATEAAATTEELRGVWFGKGINGAATDKFNVTGSTATFEKTGASTANVLLSGGAELNITTGTVTFDKYTEARIGYTAATADVQAKINVNSGILNFTNAAGNTNVRVGYTDKGLLKVSGGEVNIKGFLGIGSTGNTILDAGEGTCQISAGAVNVTGSLAVGTSTSKGSLTMTAGTLTVTNATTDIIGGGNGGNATVSLSGTSILNAATTKWKTGDFGGTGNAGSAAISLGDTAALTLKEFTIGHIGSASATETVTLAGDSTLTVSNFVTIGRDDNAAQSSINSFLNLNGGTLATTYIQKGSDDSNDLKNNVNANGGTIKALAAQPDFFKIGTFNPGRVHVNLKSGGLNFDTNGFDVGFQTGLHGTGGLTKKGAGTLTLSNLDDYTGTTTVSTGTLQVAAGNLGSSALDLQDGTTLAVTPAPSISWNVTDLTLGTTGGAAVEIRNFDSQSTGLPINATNSLVTHGTVPVKVIGTYGVGVFPLIGYPSGGSIGGSGISAFQLTGLPRGVEATLIDDNDAVSLNVTAINVLKWKGNVNSNWDINTTSNWTLGATADKYLENDNVMFDNSATNSAITLNTVVSPSSVTFDNSTQDYSLAGSGGIAGATALAKNGSGKLTLTTANTYTGATTVNAGTLALGDGVNDGSLASPLVVNDANVIFNTTATSVLSGGLSGLAFTTSITKIGAGTQVFTGPENTYDGHIKISQGTFQIGDGTVNSTSGFNTIYEIASGAKFRLNAATASSPSWANITGAGGVALNSAQTVNGTADWGGLALPSDFTGTLQVEKGRVGSNSGKDALGGTSKIQIASGAQFLAFTSVDPYTTPIEIAGNGWGEAGYPGGLRLAGNATATWGGNVTLTADSGIMAQRGATLTVTGQISGSFQCQFYAGDPAGENGILNVAPAARNSYASTVIDGRPGGSIVAGNGFAFSSGPLRVVNSSLKLNGNDFSFANLSGTGGVIGNFADSTPSVLTVGDDDSSTAFAGIIKDGAAAPLALVKTGAGTLSLTGANAYSGDTTVSHGVLSVSTAFFGDNSTVKIASGAKIDLATGTADTVGKLVINGVTVPAGTYDSTNATYGSYFTATGTGSLVVEGGYSSWATANDLDDTNNGLALDPDNDGISNLLEFYLNGDPLASDTGILPVQTSDVDHITLTFSRLDEAETDVTGQLVQYGSDLVGWTDVTIGTESAVADANGVIVTVAENGDGPDDISVQIPRNLDAGGKLFSRLKVTK